MRRWLAFGLPALSAIVVAVLAAFHGWLLALRLAEGQLAEPGVALRWVAGSALVATLLSLRRAGVPLFRGRKALVWWLLVLLVHWSATPEHGTAVEDLLMAAPATVVASVVFVAMLLGAIPAGGPRDLRRPRGGRNVCVLRGDALSAGFFTTFAARPPPL